MEPVTFDLYQDGLRVASVTADRASAFQQINHYAAVYSQDGPVEIRERKSRR